MSTEEATTKFAKDAKKEVEILFRDESHSIMGTCFEVYSERFVNQKISRLSHLS